MRGQILVFNEQKEVGAIITEDGRRFLFHISDWDDVLPPDRGMAVSFMLDAETRPRQVQLALPDPIAAATAAATITPTAPSGPTLAMRPKRKPVLILLTLFLGLFGAHRFYMGAWGWGLAQSLGLLLLSGILGALLPPLAGLLYLAVGVFTWVEVIRYIWMSDAAFDAKVKAYQAGQPGPFEFFW